MLNGAKIEGKNEAIRKSGFYNTYAWEKEKEEEKKWNRKLSKHEFGYGISAASYHRPPGFFLHVFFLLYYYFVLDFILSFLDTRWTTPKHFFFICFHICLEARKYNEEILLALNHNIPYIVPGDEQSVREKARKENFSCFGLQFHQLLCINKLKVCETENQLDDKATTTTMMMLMMIITMAECEQHIHLCICCNRWVNIIIFIRTHFCHTVWDYSQSGVFISIATKPSKRHTKKKTRGENWKTSDEVKYT